VPGRRAAEPQESARIQLPAILSAFDEPSGERIRATRVSAGWKLTASSALRFAKTGYTGEDR
jgi:hypothetical protein